MKPQWHFNERRACDRMRDPKNDAFFTAESLENLSEALVREGIQNSLDAAKRDAANVRQVSVRLSFKSEATDTERAYLLKLFEPAREHFQRGLGCNNIDDLFGKNCGYLVFEDFGTRGLTGNVEEWRLEHAEQNAFFSFFRAEGRSGKSGESLGRWGIGKQVFPTSSELHAMIGLTVRGEAPSRVLMGSAVVRTHSVATKEFQPDAWFGCREAVDDPVSPVTDGPFIDEFVKTLGLKRTTEPGLSVVIPSMDERLNLDDLRRGIIRSFFWPILQGELVVDLESPEQNWHIDAETLASHRGLLPPGEAAVIEFAAWASTAKPAEILSLPVEAAKRPDWRATINDLIPETMVAEIRDRIEKQHRIAIKIPVKVRPKADGRPESMSFFTVYIQPCRDTGHRPIFLRDGIVITDVRCPLMSGSRSLVVADDAPLAGLLGDSEGVNHTQWQKDSPKFHNKYIYGADTIKFVSRSVYEIIQRLHAAETKGDPSLLLDIFYLPVDDGLDEDTGGGGGDDEDETIKPPIDRPPPPTPRPFKLDQVKGGFVLKPTNVPFASLPAKINIEAGYAVRRGNPIKRWSSEDFAFIRAPLRQETASGVIVSKADGNQLEIEIRKPDFHFEISGFDTKRDLVVRALQQKGEDETNV